MTGQDIFARGAEAIHQALLANGIDGEDLSELLKPEAGGLGELLTEAVLSGLGIPMADITALLNGTARVVPNGPAGLTIGTGLGREETAATLYSASQDYMPVKSFRELPDRLQEPWLRAADAAFCSQPSPTLLLDAAMLSIG